MDEELTHGPALSRRSFLRAVAVGVAGAGVGVHFGSPRREIDQNLRVGNQVEFQETEFGSPAAGGYDLTDSENGRSVESDFLQQ